MKFKLHIHTQKNQGIILAFSAEKKFEHLEFFELLDIFQQDQENILISITDNQEIFEIFKKLLPHFSEKANKKAQNFFTLHRKGKIEKLFEDEVPIRCSSKGVVQLPTKKL